MYMYVYIYNKIIFIKNFFINVHKCNSIAE